MAIVTGKIVDSKTGNPILGFAVSLDELGTRTDGNGIYRFSNVPPRKEPYSLVTRSSSYKKQEYSVSVTSEGTIELRPIVAIRSGVY